MSSKRALRRKQCEGKRRHPDIEKALHAIKKLHQKHGHQGQVTAYRCKFCGGFHIGHAIGRNGIGSGWK